jgi:hypothetical protein
MLEHTCAVDECEKHFIIGLHKYLMALLFHRPARVGALSAPVLGAFMFRTRKREHRTRRQLAGFCPPSCFSLSLSFLRSIALSGCAVLSVAL